MDISHTFNTHFFVLANPKIQCMKLPEARAGNHFSAFDIIEVFLQTLTSKTSINGE